MEVRLEKDDGRAGHSSGPTVNPSWSPPRSLTPGAPTVQVFLPGVVIAPKRGFLNSPLGLVSEAFENCR